MFGPKFEHDGVRPHGTLISSTQFADLPGRHDSVQIGSSTYYKAGNSWYQRIDHNGWTCYAEIYPPAGARVATLPAEYVTLESGDKTFYATDTAVYVLEPGAGYVVVEPSLGTRLDGLPANAKKGIPVVVNGTAYYRYIGLFYRAENGPSGETYVVTASPFLSEFAASQDTTKTEASRPENPSPAGAVMAIGATSAAESGAWDTSSAPPGSPRATFLAPSGESSLPATP